MNPWHLVEGKGQGLGLLPSGEDTHTFIHSFKPTFMEQLCPGATKEDKIKCGPYSQGAHGPRRETCKSIHTILTYHLLL